MDETITLRPLGQPGDLGWVVMAHAELYASEFGWLTGVETLTARIATDYAESHDPLREGAWIAERAGRRLGCVYLIANDATTAQLRLLLVHPDGRGHQLGRRLVERCIDLARRAGYTRMILWTNHPLVAARRLYLDAGFELVSEQPHRDFGLELIGQNYELAL